MEPITTQQMRALEQAAITSGAVTGLELMERAGQGVVDAIFEHWPEFQSGTYVMKGGQNPARRPLDAVVLCGPGNNGGDGFVIARLLAQRDWEVHVYSLVTPDALPPDARTNFLRLPACVNVHGPPDRDGLADWADEFLSEYADLYIDALFGIGLKRPLGPPFVEVAEYMAQKKRSKYANNVLAVDVPSGLDADTGAALGGRPEQVRALRTTGASHIGLMALPADVTVTFHRAKPGHLTGDGPVLCGKLIVKDIGL